MSIWTNLLRRINEWLSPSILKPGKCECGHNRSTHKKGRGVCCGQWPPDEETPEWTNCSCQIFIMDDDDDDDEDDDDEDDDDEDDEPEPVTPSLDELETLYRR